VLTATGARYFCIGLVPRETPRQHQRELFYVQEKVRIAVRQFSGVHYRGALEGGTFEVRG
jgi:hypothetical protein